MAGVAPPAGLPERLRSEFEAINYDREIATHKSGGVMWRDNQSPRFCYYSWEQWMAMAPNILNAQSIVDVKRWHEAAAEIGADAYVFCWLVPSMLTIRVPFYGPVFLSESVSWVYVRPRRRSTRLITVAAKRQRRRSVSADCSEAVAAAAVEEVVSS
jgi:hypothetical protein